MIDIAGSARRSFTFPAELPLAFAYYSDLGRLLNFLPHVCLVRAFDDSAFRMLYNSTELVVYHIRIFADVQTVLEGDHVLRVRPLAGVRPVNGEAGLYSSAAPGYFASESIFRPAPDTLETLVDYYLRLEARLPVPAAARIMPGMVLDRIARSIMHLRMREIADGFIEASIAAFPDWLAELGDARWRTAGHVAPPTAASLE